MANLDPRAQCAAKPIHWVVVKESTMFISGPRKKNKWLMLKRPKLNGFQGRVFNGKIRGKGCGVHDQLMDILLIS